MRKRSSDRDFKAATNSFEAFRSRFTGQERFIDLAVITLQQLSAVCICSRNQHRWHPGNICCQTGRDKFLNEGAVRN